MPEHISSILTRMFGETNEEATMQNPDRERAPLQEAPEIRWVLPL